MSKFQIGDRVRITSTSASHTGEVGVVESIYGSIYPYELRLPCVEDTYPVEEDEIELVKSAPEGATTLSQYQDAALSTAKPTARQLSYLIPGLAAEAGEVAGKWAKYVRDETSYDDLREDVAKELGDVLWFVAATAYYVGYDLEEIAEKVTAKLQDRQARGVIEGSGDDR